MTHPSSPGGVRFGGGAVTLGVVLLCLLTTLVAAPAAATPTPAPAGAAATPVTDSPSPTPTPTPAPASTSYKLQHDEFAIMISPTRLVVNPDDAGTRHGISVINRGQAPVPVTVQKRNFSVGRDGSLRYAKDSPFGADKWVDVSPTSFVLQPGTSQLVTADIATPEKVEPGDHEVAVVFLVPSKSDKGNIKVNRGLAAPIYITAPGPIDDTVALTALTAPRFSAWGPVSLTATLENQGTVHRDFRGGTALHVRASGKPSVFPDFTIPRGTTRDVATQWKPPLVCICHAQVSFVNAGGPPQALTVRVIVFPWPIALGLLVMAAGLILVRHHHRRHRRHRRSRRLIGARTLVGTEDG